MNQRKGFPLVAQEDDFGCGIACVASRVRRSYREVANRLVQPPDVTEGCTGRLLARLLAQYKYTYTKNLILLKERSPTSLPAGSILFMKGGRYGRWGHYFLRCEDETWMDPWYNLNHQPRRAGYRTRIPRETQTISALLPRT